jgi:hypothetical protein
MRSVLCVVCAIIRNSGTISLLFACSEEEGRNRLDAHRRRVRKLTAGVTTTPLPLLPGETDDVENGSPDAAAISVISFCSSAASASSSSAAAAAASAITPEIIEVDESTVSVVVGEQQFVVDVSLGHTFDSRHLTSEGQTKMGANVVFDPHASQEDGSRNVPLTRPVFLGSPTDSVSLHARL